MPNKIEIEIERLLKSFKQKKLPVEIELLALHENAMGGASRKQE
jgi:hypothetical protein